MCCRVKVVFCDSRISDSPNVRQISIIDKCIKKDTQITFLYSAITKCVWDRSVRDVTFQKNDGLSIFGAYMFSKIRGVEYISPVTIKKPPSLSDTVSL